jgi:hypothetical protein
MVPPRKISCFLPLFGFGVLSQLPPAMPVSAFQKHGSKRNKTKIITFQDNAKYAKFLLFPRQK